MSGIPRVAYAIAEQLKVTCYMKIRRDLAFLSSVLFTIALVWFIPWQISNALTGRHLNLHPELNADLREYARLQGDLGVISLTIILIGLIVIWAGYVKRVQWTWFVMFLIVFGWAFTELIWPFHLRFFFVPATYWEIFSAIRKDGAEGLMARAAAADILIFLLMVLALFLPVRSFFFPRDGIRTTRIPKES